MVKHWEQMIMERQVTECVSTEELEELDSMETALLLISENEGRICIRILSIGILLLIIIGIVWTHQTQELLHGVDHPGVLQLLVADQVAEHSEIDFRALQQLIHRHDLLLRAECCCFFWALQINLHRVLLRHILA